MEESSSAGGIPVLMGKMEVLASDTNEVKAALALQAVNIEAWVKSLNSDDIKKLSEIAEKHILHGASDTAIRAYADFINEVKALEDRVFQSCFVNMFLGLKKSAFQSSFGILFWVVFSCFPKSLWKIVFF